MSYTADPRILFAAERTLLAWQRSAIALMGFGFVRAIRPVSANDGSPAPGGVAARLFAGARGCYCCWEPLWP